MLINNDVISPQYEPAYHLILRHFGLVKGGVYSGYDHSLEPIVDNMPYQIIGFVAGDCPAVCPVAPRVKRVLG